MGRRRAPGAGFAVAGGCGGTRRFLRCWRAPPAGAVLAVAADVAAPGAGFAPPDASNRLITSAVISRDGST